MSIFTQKKPPKVYYGLNLIGAAGPMMIGVTEDNKLCRLSFAEGHSPASLLRAWRKEWPKTLFEPDERRVRSIAKALSKGHKVDLYMAGTAFQLMVWKGLLKIRRGQTLSYGELAAKIGKPKAVRAVGTALGKNPIPFLVPCHRIIAGNGTLGGFSGGLAVKERLLKAELGATECPHRANPRN